MRWSPTCRCWARWSASATCRPTGCGSRRTAMNLEACTRSSPRSGPSGPSLSSPASLFWALAARATASASRTTRASRSTTTRLKDRAMPTKIEKDAVSGQRHDRPRMGRRQGAQHAAADLVGLHLLRLASCSPSSTACSTRPGRGSPAIRRACSAIPAVPSSPSRTRRRRPRRAPGSSTGSAPTSLAEIRQGSRAVQLRPGRRPLGLPDQLHAVPWRGRRRQPGLPQPGRRRLDLGRQHRADLRRPSSTASATPTTSRAQSLMPRFGADGLLTGTQVARRDRLCAEPVGHAQRRRRKAPRSAQEQCVACHGGRQGQPGAGRAQPRPTASGSMAATATRSIGPSSTPATAACRRGAARLDEATIKMLAVYVHALGGGR